MTVVADKPFGKMELLALLAERHGYRSYLELCTPTTGRVFDALSSSPLRRQRLVYMCPLDFDDGMAIDARSCTRDIDYPLTMLAPFDVALVDPFHEYETSYRDIVAVFSRLPPGGAMLVHDCLPEDPGIATPRFKDGSWCGVTYRAYLDFVLDRDDLTYFTVDTDYGCGVIQKLTAHQTRQRRLLRSTGVGHSRLARHWRAIADSTKAYRFMHRHKHELLDLRTVDDTVAGLQRTASILA